jgi:hypothetical protein
MVYLNLDKNFVDKHLKEWNEEAINTFGEEEGKDMYLFNDGEKARIEEIDEDAGELYVVCETSKIGYISLDVKLTTEDLLDLIEFAVKKLNKFKTILEGLK